MAGLRKIVSESIEKAFLIKETVEDQKNKLALILNSLEFKNDVLQAGGDIYAVGGIVRDALMNKKSDDLDIVVKGVPYDQLFKILSKYGKATDTSVEKEDGKDFGATKFVSHNEEFNKLLSDNSIRKEIDVMLPRRDAKDPNIKGHRGIKSDVNPNYTIHDDLQRRDISINAIALDLNGNVIDNGTGKEDIEKGVIRAVSADAFIEDPLRMLRAIRFAARFNYKWDENTLNLIRDNAYLLSDKNELPRERFLMEFEKMIGKSDLGKAVKTLVDLGLYKAIFGIDSKIKDFNKFDQAKNVAEFCYLLFQNEPVKNIVPLSFNNITNENEDISYLEALIKYREEVVGKDLDFVARVNKLADIYKKSSQFLLNSSFVFPADREVANNFANGSIPKGDHDVNLKGDEFRNFIIEAIKSKLGVFNPKEDGKKMGYAKNLTLQAIYKKEINNDPESIKRFLLQNIDKWLY